MVVRIELDNIDEIISKIKDSSGCAKDAKKARNYNVPYYVSNSYGIGYELDDIENLTKCLRNDLEDLKKLLKDYKSDSKVILRVDIRSRLDELFESFIDLCEAAIELQNEIIALVIDGAIALLEYIEEIGEDIGRWIDEHALMFEIIKDIITIAAYIGMMFVPGVGAIFAIGAAIKAVHGVMELSYDVAACFEDDEEKKAEMMNKSAVDIYADIGGDTGYKIGVAMELTSTLFMMTGPGSAAKTSVKTIKSFKMVSDITYDVAIEGEISISDTIGYGLGYLDVKYNTDTTKVIKETYKLVDTFTGTSIDAYEYGYGDDIIQNNTPIEGVTWQ